MSTHFGCDTNAPTVVKYTPECTYGYLENENFQGEDPRTPLPIRRKVKIGPATPLRTYILYDIRIKITMAFRNISIQGS